MISVENYSVSLGDFKLDNINLNIGEHEVFALLGETGSGKSILLESIAGFYAPDAGSIRYNEIPVWNTPLENRHIGFVYQDYSLFPHMKTKQNIEFGLKMHKVPSREREKIVSEIMKMLKIEHLGHRYPGTLSGGEQQRAALARALVLQPEVLFMDEPFSALDPNTKKNMYQLIRDIHSKFNCTIIFVTHDFNEAAELADRVGIMVHGKLKAVCNSSELFGAHQDTDVAKFLGTDNGASCIDNYPLNNSRQAVRLSR